jgi:hypothetical protein
MVDLLFFLFIIYYLILLVEYLWNYMRNNQKPRPSVLRKKTGNLFSLNRKDFYDLLTFDVDGGIVRKSVDGSVLYGTV